MGKEDQFDVKVVLLGKAYAGKTCMVERYIHQRFSDTAYQNTIGAAFASNKLKIGGKTVVLNIWDTAGGERYQSMSRIYYRGARAAILCYDLTDRTSFDKVRYWAGELQLHEPNCKLYLCGTKKDLIDLESDRAVSNIAVSSLSQDLQSEVYETSSVTGESINELFLKIATEFLDSLKHKVQETETDSFQIKEEDKRHFQCSWCNS